MRQSLVMLCYQIGGQSARMLVKIKVKMINKNTRGIFVSNPYKSLRPAQQIAVGDRGKRERGTDIEIG